MRASRLGWWAMVRGVRANSRRSLRPGLIRAGRRGAGGVCLGLFLVAGVTASAAACTCFLIDHEAGRSVGRNYDWDFGDGFLIVNPRGLSKPVSLDPTRDEGSWTALHGSVTFNQYGREFPCGGMNERGLVVEVLWLNGTTYPPVDDRRALESVQWLQYQLDTAATVDQVLASLRQVRVYGDASVHFYLADSTGAAAALEFLSGKEVVHRTGESMPAPVLANHTYAESADFLESCQGWGGRRLLDRSSRSLVRFARAALGARTLAASASPPGPAEAFGLLDEVAQGGHTQWSIVYDLKHLRIRFRTATNPDESVVDLSEVDFSCGRAVQWIDLSRVRRGNVRGQWADYDARRNRELIAGSYRKTEFLRETPKATLDRLAAHPGRSRCLP